MSARLVSLVAAASLVFACGGTTASPGGASDGGGNGSGSGGGSGSGSGGGSGSGSGGPTSGPCPSTAPSAGSTCGAALSGDGCEYGDDPNLSCNTVATCSGGSWTVKASDGSPTCPTPAATGACPASYAAAQTTGACTQSGLACAYPQGRCECAEATGGPPTVGPQKIEWLCDDPPSGCPSPRPKVGSACAQSGSCSYGACTIPGGVTLACTGGTWQVSETACAL